MEFLQLKKKQKNISSTIKNIIFPISFILLLISAWQILSITNTIPAFLLPSPISVIKAFIGDFTILIKHSSSTLLEAFIGLSSSLVVSFLLAIFMDRFSFVHKSIYPVLVLSQTIPVIAIAPLLTLWLGYSYLPKIALVFITCFFPLTVGLLDGFASTDKDTLDLVRSFNANKYEQFLHVKLPYALPSFFSGLKISMTYAVVGAVISEWLGGTSGLGVYMTRVRKSYDYDKMFAVIFLISIISILLITLTKFIEKKAMPYKRRRNNI